MCRITGKDNVNGININLCRWFDKSLQLIVTQGGHAAINFEHSWGDGVAVLRLFEELYKDRKHNYSDNNPTMEGVVRLDFNLSPQITDAIEQGKQEMGGRCKALSFDILQYKRFGKNDIKKLKLSPDAILQLAIQVL